MNALVQTCIVIGVFWGNRALLVGIVRAVMIERDIVSVQVMPYRFSGRTQFAEVSPGVFLVDLPTPQAIGSTNSFFLRLMVFMIMADHSLWTRAVIIR